MVIPGFPSSAAYLLQHFPLLYSHTYRYTARLHHTGMAEVHPGELQGQRTAAGALPP